MKQIIRYTGYILLLLAAGYLIWKFYYIAGWVLIAAILSFIGEPLVHAFDSVHIRKFQLPRWISTLLALLCIMLFFLGLVSLFVPLIIKEVEEISKINMNNIGDNLPGTINQIEDKLHRLGALPDNQSLIDLITVKMKSLVNFKLLGTFLGGFVNSAANLLLGFFAIIFITFFFLKDEHMFEENLLLLVPEKHHEKTRAVVGDSKKLLKRYFTGILLEITSVITLLSLGLWILGIKNALVIAFFGGIMNLIPYLGPIIGSGVGITIGMITFLVSGQNDQLMTDLLKLGAVFFMVNFTDSHVLQPVIYSRSIKSHPLEIFMAIIVGGGLAGLPGMLLAVPVYTILRVIAREFLQEFRVVRKLTQTMDQ